MAVALSRVRARASIPYTCRVALATSAAGWPAAGYGALAIAFAGDFDATGSAWIFGLPFILLLTVATAVHMLTMGLGGVPAWLPGIRAVNRALDNSGRPIPCSDAEMLAAARAIARLPLWDGIATGVLSAAVVVGCELLEWAVAGSRSPNFGIIARSGVVACGIYMSAGLTLAEVVVRPRRARREALQEVSSLDDRLVLSAARLIARGCAAGAALWVAVEIGCSPKATPTAYGLLIGLRSR
jgi:hypothetical protein